MTWVVSARNDDGGWGGGPSTPSTIEETALAVEALAGATVTDAKAANGAMDNGCAWLIEHTNRGRHFPPAPIGLYFARLWYHERLYPLIFTVAALERVLASRPPESPLHPSVG
jgi:squalene-hopene/tetraprenyl-beta-curcumene cyclase